MRQYQLFGNWKIKNVSGLRLIQGYNWPLILFFGCRNWKNSCSGFNSTSWFWFWILCRFFQRSSDWKLVVSKEYRRSVIARFHNNPTGDHAGWYQTLCKIVFLVYSTPQYHICDNFQELCNKYGVLICYTVHYLPRADRRSWCQLPCSSFFFLTVLITVSVLFPFWLSAFKFMELKLFQELRGICYTIFLNISIIKHLVQCDLQLWNFLSDFYTCFGWFIYIILTFISVPLLFQ